MDAWHCNYELTTSEQINIATFIFERENLPKIGPLWFNAMIQNRSRIKTIDNFKLIHSRMMARLKYRRQRYQLLK